MDKITTIVNFGCSFAYGNRAAEFDTLCEEHRSPATYLAERLGLKEINLARPGNSNEGIVDTVLLWLSKTPTEQVRESLVLVGWTGGHRFGYVSDDQKVSNKIRVGKGAGKTAEQAFSMGPENRYRYQIDKWDDRWAAQYINLQETARLSLYRSLLAFSAIEHKHELKSVQYHGLSAYPSSAYDAWANRYLENDDLKKMISTERFYEFETASLQGLTKKDRGLYFVSETDSHPNQVAYKAWTDLLYDWMCSRDFFGYGVS